VLAGNVFVNTFSISVEPHSSGTARKSCPVSKDINLSLRASFIPPHPARRLPACS